MEKDPNVILSSTTPEVKKLVGEVLALEKEFQHIQNLESSGNAREIVHRIIKAVEREISE